MKFILKGVLVPIMREVLHIIADKVADGFEGIIESRF